MNEREVCVDTNLVLTTFDAPAFAARDLARGLSERSLRLVIPEITLLQAVAYHDVDKVYQRFCNIVAFAHEAGERCAIGAPLYRIHQEELDGASIPSTPLFTDDYRDGMFRAADSRAQFGVWQAHARDEARDGLDVAHRLQLDQQAAERMRAAFPEDTKTQSRRGEEMRKLLPRIPAEFDADNFFLCGFVKDEEQRKRIAAAPERFPSTVCLAIALTLNGFGAGLDLKGHSEFHFLSAARDSWTDALLLASSAYADVFATDDRNLRKRAAVLSSWGRLRPAAMSWAELWNAA